MGASVGRASWHGCRLPGRSRVGERGAGHARAARVRARPAARAGKAAGRPRAAPVSMLAVRVNLVSGGSGNARCWSGCSPDRHARPGGQRCEARDAIVHLGLRNLHTSSGGVTMVVIATITTTAEYTVSLT